MSVFILTLALALFMHLFYVQIFFYLFQAEISSKNFVINRCYLPCETTVISIYISGLFVLLICLLVPTKINRQHSSDKEMVFVNKSH